MIMALDDIINFAVPLQSQYSVISDGVYPEMRYTVWAGCVGIISSGCVQICIWIHKTTDISCDTGINSGWPSCNQSRVSWGGLSLFCCGKIWSEDSGRRPGSNTCGTKAVFWNVRMKRSKKRGRLGIVVPDWLFLVNLCSVYCWLEKVNSSAKLNSTMVS